MILTKNKTVISEKHKTKFKKSSFIKKSIIGGVILFTALLSWDASIYLSNSIHISNKIDANIAHFAGLNDYNTFKEKINNTPYNDAQFREDLKLFGYMFANNDKSLMKFRYGKYDMRGFMIDRYLYKNNMDEKFGVMLKEAEKYKNDNIDILSVVNDKYSKFFTLANHSSYNNNSQGRNYIISLEWRLKGDYSASNKMLFIDDEIYENMRKLTKEYGFSEDLFFRNIKEQKEQEKEYVLAANKQEQEQIYKVYTEESNKAFNKLKDYYKNGEYEKMRGIFKIMNGFSHLVIDDVKYINNVDFGISSSYVFTGILSDTGLIKYNENSFEDFYMKPAKIYSKMKGSYSKESEKYYSGDSYYFMKY